MGDNDSEIFTNELAVRLKELRIEHRRLDIEINQLQDESPNLNQLMIQRIKKRKLWLKDTIVKLESKRIPDLDA